MTTHRALISNALLVLGLVVIVSILVLVEQIPAQALTNAATATLSASLVDWCKWDGWQWYFEGPLPPEVIQEWTEAGYVVVPANLDGTCGTPEPATATPTSIPTNTPTDIPTEVPTTTPTAVPTETPTSIPTNTATPTNIPTNTNIPTATPTQTPTDTPTNTATPSDTPSNTPTATPTQTPTDTPQRPRRR